MNNFEDSVRNWVRLDDEVRRTNERVRELREERNAIADNISCTCTSNNRNCLLIIKQYWPYIL